MGAASEYTGLSLQGNNANFSDIFADTLTWVTNSANAGKKWVVACDEPGDAQAALRPDSDPGNSHIDGRKNALLGHALILIHKFRYPDPPGKRFLALRDFAVASLVTSRPRRR